MKGLGLKSTGVRIGSGLPSYKIGFLQAVVAGRLDQRLTEARNQAGDR